MVLALHQDQQQKQARSLLAQAASCTSPPLSEGPHGLGLGLRRSCWTQDNLADMSPDARRGPTGPGEALHSILMALALSATLPVSAGLEVFQAALTGC